jgi:glucose-6-phosphate isomerase
VPYIPGLQDFSTHLQQLMCESNGKTINPEGHSLSYPTSPLLVPGLGSNAQHAYFQLLHQGSSITPVEFIGLASGVKNGNAVPENMSHLAANHRLQTQNILAQMVALALGDAHNETRFFLGNRPSTLIWMQDFLPETLGALLAYYENMVMFQGALWQLNSFDQPGVSLGKSLAQDNATVNALFDGLSAV